VLGPSPQTLSGNAWSSSTPTSKKNLNACVIDEVGDATMPDYGQ
jgi:hypothetical protein